MLHTVDNLYILSSSLVLVLHPVCLESLGGSISRVNDPYHLLNTLLFRPLQRFAPPPKGDPVRSVELTDEEARETNNLGLLTAKKVAHLNNRNRTNVSDHLNIIQRAEALLRIA